LVIISIPLVIVIRLVRPWFWIRFGYVRSDAIGHAVFDPEYYLCELETENKKTFDFFYFQTVDHPNMQWYLMVNRKLSINRFFRYIDLANQLIPGGQIHNKIAGSIGSRDLKGYLDKTKPHFSFTDEENKRGLKFLETLGLNAGVKFVCLLVRDSAYKEEFGDKRDWSYHSYRESDIQSYKEAALFLAKKGYWIFRMGKSVNDTFDVDHSQILDYANSPNRCDLLDIWLMANCFFCISTGSGLDEVTRIFRRPIIFVNYLPIFLFSTYSHCMIVPKNLIWKGTNRRLNLTEHYSHSYGRSGEYEKVGISIIDLTAEEILLAIMEFVTRLEGKWEESDEDSQLQARFWELFKSYPDFNKFHGKIHAEARIGAHFLRNNQNWLIK
jgi:putative glycosyltransferase (TIGR04372 family)